MLHNPKTGETFTFLTTGRETNGQLFRMRYTMAPHARIADEHSHPNQDMTIEVISGALTCTVGGVEKVIGAGERVAIPAGTFHFQRNDTDEKAHAIEEYRPALDMQDFFEVLAGWANDGKTNAFGMPSLFRRVALHRHFLASIRSRSHWRNFEAWLLSPLATLLGYRRELRRYVSS